ncbi:MAG TPA: superoxide dismutase [Prolixibacteraceae bacterium]|nr:superoxide dismutase [Prolixibacteraceae bacterium]
MRFTLPTLEYAYNALEPLIDARTMEIHHTKHHAAYTNNLNTLIAGTDAEGKSIEAILAEIEKYPVGVRNNGGGFYNHNLYWKVLTPGGPHEPSGNLKQAIVRDFGSLENLKEKFSQAAATRFGSGWAWLVDANGVLKVTSTPNQDNPLMGVSDVKGKPILGIDVWEHAYYLHYQNRRPEYIEAFWKLINWEVVSHYFHG